MWNIKIISEINREEIVPVCKALGPVDTARFLSSLKTGHGDYSRERHTWLPSDQDVLFSNIQKLQEARNTKKRVICKLIGIFR